MYNDYPIAPLSSAKASFAVRFLIHDKPGVLLQVAKEFADRGISINGVNQDLKPTRPNRAMTARSSSCAWSRI